MEKDSNACIQRTRRGTGDGMHIQGDPTQHGKPLSVVCRHQPAAREGQAGPNGVADRLVVPLMPGNAGGGKGPDFGHACEGNNGLESGASLKPPRKTRRSRNKLWRPGEAEQWACAWRRRPSESRMREIRTSGSTSGMWKRGTERLLRHRQTKGAETDRPLLNYRATSRLYAKCGTSTRPSGGFIRSN